MLKAVVNVLKSAWAIALALHIPSVTIHALFGMKNC
jgi:succinate dehydrogenase hydrophobic anchor subunit